MYSIPDYVILQIGRNDGVTGSASLATDGVLTVAAAPTPGGTIGVGQTIVGGSINATITALISGTGGAGTYQTDQTGSTIGATSITSAWPDPVFQANYKAVIDNILAQGVSKVACIQVFPDQTNAYHLKMDRDIRTVVAGYSSSVVQYFGGDTDGGNNWNNIHTIEASPYSGTHPCSKGVGGTTCTISGTTYDGYAEAAAYKATALSSFLTP